MRPGDDVIERLKAEHGEVYLVEAGDVGVIVRPPTRAEYRRFRALAMDEKKRADAVERLARDCVLWPDADGLDELLERRPALTEVVGGELLKLAGFAEEVEIKKL